MLLEFRSSSTSSASDYYSGHDRGRFIGNSKTSYRVILSLNGDSCIPSDNFLWIRGFLFGLKVWIVDLTLLVRVAVISTKDISTSLAV